MTGQRTEDVPLRHLGTSFLPSSTIRPNVQTFIVFYWVKKWSKMKNVLGWGTWRCEIADSSLPSCPWASQAISFFIDRVAEFHLDGSSRSRPSIFLHLDCFCFQVTSYLLLQLFQFLGACVWRHTSLETHKENTFTCSSHVLHVFFTCLGVVLSGSCRHTETPPRCKFIKWIIK